MPFLRDGYIIELTKKDITYIITHMKKIIFFGVFHILIINAYADDLDQKARIFWNYISKNEIEIFNINNPEASLYTEIYNQIQSIDRNIYVMLGNEIKNNKKDIIITAGGNADYFSLCDEIVKLAPKYTRLNPISLFPPLEKIEPFVFSNIVLNVEDVNVHLKKNDKKIDLLFLLNVRHLSFIQNDNTGQIYNVYMHLLSIMTQQILGERIFGEKIDSGEIALVNLVIPNIPLLELKNIIK
jgi:hypothetical protein